MAESSPERILVTSALPYANGPVHIGHIVGAYLPADLFCRYQRLKGRDVLFIGGSDEYGVAIVMRARAEGRPPQEIIAHYHPLIKESFARLGISFDHYGRTSDAVHVETSQQFFRTLAGKDAFTLRTEKQLYDPEAELFLADRFVRGTCPVCGYEEAYGDQCERCGTSLSPAELIDPRSALTDATPELRETTHWYLPLGDWQPRLEAWIATKDDWKPNVLGQIQSWFKDGLRDRAITRDVPWGVPVPEDVAEAAGIEAAGKVIYVWFDAPIGYISSTRQWAQQQGDPDRWKIYWQDEGTRLYHFIGKDNIVFHTLMFPAMLMAHGGYVLPENVPANEFLNLEGKKFSTSRNWAVWLHDALDDFEADLLRYALATMMPETKDADFVWTEFQARINGELADVLGNFVHRALTFAHRYFDRQVPTLEAPSALDRETLEALQRYPARIGEAYERFRFREAVFETIDLARLGNKYFNDSEPWKTRKTDVRACANTIHVSLQLCAALSVLIEPILPTTAARLRAMLRLEGIRESDAGGADGRGWDDAGLPLLQAGQSLGEAEILFDKIEDDVIAAQVARLGTPETEEEEDVPYEPLRDEIEYDDFARLDLRLGTVVAAERIPKSKKLLRLEVDLGFEQRQVLAGVAEQMAPEDLLDKQVVVVANLKPRKMMGLESQGMLLMAENRDGHLAPLTAVAENGAVIR